MEHEHIAGVQRMRFKEATTFTCARCGGVKTSKLIAISDQDCSKRFCNGCFGFLVAQQLEGNPSPAHKTKEDIKRWELEYWRERDPRHGRKDSYFEKVEAEVINASKEAATQRALKHATRRSREVALAEVAAERRQREAERQRQLASGKPITPPDKPAERVAVVGIDGVVVSVGKK